MILKAPYPWFGGKSRVAPLVWERFGDTPNYVEPFFGSGAVLLGRPTPPGTESINDLDCFVSNFWRAIQADPEAVARHADWPVSEADLHARHRWLVSRGEFREAMMRDPAHYDATIAGWWAWGLCQWIGTGWCSTLAATPAHGRRWDGPAPSRQLPHMGDAGMGLHRKLPHMGNAGRGLHRQLPHMGDAGRGLHRKLPHMGNAGRGILDWFEALSNRLRRVRIACGNWDRILGPSVTERHGITSVFLDPPYSSEEHEVTYAASAGDVGAEVRRWAIENGGNPNLRIALCGYEGEHAMPASWSEVAWKAHGGYGSQGDGQGRENAERERVWFSPHCLPARQPGLFDNEVSA